MAVIRKVSTFAVIKSLICTKWIESDYYPFGTPYSDETSITNADLQQYKYNSKELDRMHGLDTYDYGARQYDPVLCRWDRIDPLCEKYYGVSPYVYCMNNPVKNVDPDGRKVVLANNSSTEFTNQYNKAIEYLRDNGASAAIKCGEIPAGTISRDSHSGITYKTDSSTSRCFDNMDEENVQMIISSFDELPK